MNFEKDQTCAAIASSTYSGQLSQLARPCTPGELAFCCACPFSSLVLSSFCTSLPLPNFMHLLNLRKNTSQDLSPHVCMLAVLQFSSASGWSSCAMASAGFQQSGRHPYLLTRAPEDFSLLGTPKAYKHKHFIGISLIGLHYEGVYMGYPYPYFCLCAFFGALV